MRQYRRKLTLRLIAGIEGFRLRVLTGETVAQVKQVVAERFDAGKDSIVLQQRGAPLHAGNRLWYVTDQLGSDRCPYRGWYSARWLFDE